ncbi:AIPR family protein, partial [Gammaproteobacteria bacterium]|nr:AIPR family protein [Gammaproteobacteria bacterium]
VHADVGGEVHEEKFFDDISELLCEAGVYDDIQKDAYINSRRGIRIDGWNWNKTERILSAVITKFSNDEDLVTISKSEIEQLGKQASRFISLINDHKFLDSLDASDTALELAKEMSSYLSDLGKDGDDGFRPAAHKCRVIVLTDYLLSERVNLLKLKIENIHNKEAFFEIWDLKRIRNLTLSGTESEPCNVDFAELCSEGGLPTLPANIFESDISSYICVMPGTVLRDLYDNYGQRLLESNVRTFLQFRGKVNQGMKSTLLLNPENFFAYNNGLTVTASKIELSDSSGQLMIKKLDNMQIVNGGQTTSAIYFSPLSKGKQKGIDFRKIDLTKVFVQMKLTVIENDEDSEIIKSNVAKYANSQNIIQAADFVSKHPIHREIEKHSRSVWAPPSQNSAIPTRWFYERTRGQYQTKILAFKGAAKANDFKAENPKQQMITKIDMAKFENTWRMKPWEVAVGGQDHLGKKIGPVLMKEWDKNPDNFGLMFFKDLVGKAILFKVSDSSIGKSEWYKAQIGLKAQTTTFTIAYLRYKLNKSGKDINLERIFKSQTLSDSLLSQILDLAPAIRNRLTECCIANGNTNPAMYAKKIDAWEQIKAMPYELSIISDKDLITNNQAKEIKESNLELNLENAEIDIMKFCTDITDDEWTAIYEFLKQLLPKESKEMKTLNKFTQLSSPAMQKKLQYPFDFNTAQKLRNMAIDDGFIVTN